MKNLVVFSMILLVSVLGVSPCSAAQNLTDALADFFRSVTAEVIFQDADTVVLDRGFVQGIAVGDLFAMVAKETPVRHPESGQVIDTLVEFGPLVQVTRVKPDLAYGSLATDADRLFVGVKTRRFENIPVYFIDRAGSGFPLFAALRKRLPHLLWKDYLTAEQPGMFDGRPGLAIKYAPGAVEVLNQNGQILFAGTGDAAVDASRAPALSPRSEQDVAARPPQNPPRPVPTEGGWSMERIALPDEGAVEALRGVDFDRDGIPEVLLGLDGELVLGRLAGTALSEICRFTPDGRKRIVDISALDLDGDGAPEVAVTMLEGDRFDSRIFKFRKDELIPVAASPMLFATFSPVGEAPFLIGQYQRTLLNYRPEFFRITLQDGQIATSPYDLPLVRQPYGVTQLSDDQGNIVTVFLSQDHRLQVADSQQRLLWESSDVYGGSDTFLKVPLEGSRSAGSYEKFFLKGPVARFGESTLLTARHELSDLFRNNPTYKNGKIVALSWSGVGLEETRESPNLGGFINGFTRFDGGGDGRNELLVSVVLPRKGMFTSSGSALFLLSEAEAR